MQVQRRGELLCNDCYDAANGAGIGHDSRLKGKMWNAGGYNKENLQQCALGVDGHCSGSYGAQAHCVIELLAHGLEEAVAAPDVRALHVSGGSRWGAC